MRNTSKATPAAVRARVAYVRRVHVAAYGHGTGLAGWLAYGRASVAMRWHGIAGCGHGPRCGCTGPVLWPRPNRPAGPVRRVAGYAWWCGMQAHAQRASLPGSYVARVAWLWRTTGPNR